MTKPLVIYFLTEHENWGDGNPTWYEYYKY